MLIVIKTGQFTWYPPVNADGERKLKFAARKNWERKKYDVTTLPVHISLSDVTVFRVSIALPLLCSNDKDEKEEHSLTPRNSTELKVSLPLSYFTCLPLRTLSAFRSRIMTVPLLPAGWVDATQSEGELALCCFSHSAAPTPSIRFTIIIKENFTWTIFFRAQRVETNSSLVLQDVPPILNSLNDVACLITVIDSSKLCVGNPDDRFIPLLHQRGEISRTDVVCMYTCTYILVCCILPVLLYPIGTQIVATQDHPIFGTPTIRHSNCSIHIPASQTSDRCKPCQKFRPALRSKLNQSGARGSSVEHRTDPHSHTLYRCLTKDELTNRLRQLSVLHVRTARQLRQL